MKVNIASFGGRSHLLDIARELDKLGLDVKFYSYLPNKRAKKFGLKNEINSSYFFLAIPFLFLFKTFGFRKSLLEKYFFVFDYIVAYLMRPCDIFIGHSPMHYYSLKYAKKKFKATVILERGTSHALDEFMILHSNPKKNRKNLYSKKWIDRDLRSYYLADYISVGANHVKESFLKYGFPSEKIFVNNYGVNLNHFYPTKHPDNDCFDLIFVGQWCYRKGCDLISKVCLREGYRFLHVGSIVDMEFPINSFMTHIDVVDETELINYYKRAKVFVLPSRDEGLALVQLQALTCGLPVVCSKKSGGIDLLKYFNKENLIYELEEFNCENLVKNINLAIKEIDRSVKIRDNFSNNLADSSWSGYGKRYYSFLLNHSNL